MDDNSHEQLRAVSLFAGLSSGELKAIGERCNWRDFKKGAEILDQSETSTDVFFLLSGKVAAKSYSVSGREVTYSEMGASSMFGEFSAIDGQPRSAMIEALEETRVAIMSAGIFREVIAQHPSVALNLANHLVAKIRTLTTRVFEFSTLTVRYRLCLELIRLAEAAGHRDARWVISPAPTHYHLATLLSTHREAVSKEMSHLSSLGILKARRKEIEILEMERLRTMVTLESP
ncbi:MAG: Crp/Fnr family transcriptional regulator [Rhizobiaceae bacterium]